MMGYNSSSSNLSPLAIPFTVDRSTLPKPSPNTNPPVDLTDPPRYRPALNSSYPNWVNTHQPISRPDLFPTPNPEFDPVLPPTSLTSYVPNGSSFRFGVNPYYPSYVSSSVGDVGSEHSGYHLLSNSDVVTSIGSFHDDYVHSLLGSDCVGPQWVGLWGEGFADWPQTQCSQVQTEGSFFPKESCTNQGLYSCGDLTKYKEGTLGIGAEKHVESTSSKELDPKFSLGDSKSISPNFSSTLASASGSVIPRTCMQVPNRVNFKDPEVAFSNPYEQHFLSFDAHASGSLLHMESSPAVVSVPTLHNAGTFSNVKSGNRETSKDFCGGNPNSMREPYPCMSSGGKNYFDDSKLKSHLEAIAHDFTEFSSAKTENFQSRNGASKDISNACSSEQHVIQVSRLNLDDLRLNIEGPKVVDCLENYSWNEDNLNPVVDSPCWKGASASHFTPFEVSESATPWDIGKVEVASSQPVQSRDIFTHMAKDSARVSVNMPNESSPYYDNGDQEILLASPLKNPSVADLLPAGGIDDSVNYGLKQGIVYEIQNSNVITELKGESTASDKSMGDSDTKAPKMKEQGFVGGLTSEKPVEPEVANADSVMHENCNLDRCSYNVPFRSTGHVYSQSSSLGAPSKIKSFCGESRPQICIQMLVNTIHNLSELLLFHCSTDTYELTAKEHAILKSVIENIDACVPNKVERLASKQQWVVPQSATSLVESSPELQKGSLENQNIQECDHGNVSRRKEEDIFNGVFSRTAVDIVKEENRTQAIKKILAEHFKTEGEAEPDALLYQNLWLEAEALLCSVNYMARYNQMKNENKQNSRGMSIGKQPSSQISSGPQIRETLVANTIGGPISRSSIPHSKILNANNFYDVTGRYHLLRLGDDVNSFATTIPGESSSCNVLLNLKKDEKLELEAKDNLKEIFVSNSPLSSSTCHTADNEASVMARFLIVKNRHHESNLVNASTMAKVSSSMEIRDLSKVSRWADEVKDAVMGDAPVQPLTSTISNIASSAEASVLSRFQVLKQRGDKLSPHNKEENHFYDTCYGHIGQRSDGLFAVDGSENKMNDNNVHLSANVTDPIKVGQPTKKVEDAGGAYASKKHLQISSTSSPADDVDASVMAQLHILKSQDDKSSPCSNKELKLCDDNCELVGWTRNRSTGRDGSKDEMVDVKVGSEQQTHAASSMDGKVTFKEFHLFAKGDPMNQYGSTSGHADKSDASWYDNFSSDWEHILKEDFAVHKS